MISSLIKLQSNEINDGKDVETYRMLDSRINSISLLHEMLYKSDSQREISIKQYVEELISRMEELHHDSFSHISIESNFIEASF